MERGFGVPIQSIARSRRIWLAMDALSCNIRDHGRVACGPAEIPMLERPVLQHARVAMGKAERFAEQAEQALPQAYETVVHNSCYAMFRAALLAIEGSASTNHGGVAKAFQEMVKQRRIKAGRDHASALDGALELRIKADYGDEDLTEAGGRLRDRVGPFLSFRGKLVAMAAPGD